jgi:hypothetical protein
MSLYLSCNVTKSTFGCLPEPVGDRATYLSKMHVQRKRTYSIFLEFEVLTAVSTKMAVFCVIARVDWLESTVVSEMLLSPS